MPMMSTNTEAGPSAPAKSPSSTRTSKVRRSPSLCGLFSSTTTSRAETPSLLSTDTVAFGGSLAKSPVVHSSSRASVGRCPAALTGRSANTIEVGLTPANVRVWPCRLAPRAFMTNSDGTMSTLTVDFPGGDAPGGFVVGGRLGVRQYRQAKQGDNCHQLTDRALQSHGRSPNVFLALTI